MKKKIMAILLMTVVLCIMALIPACAQKEDVAEEQVEILPEDNLEKNDFSTDDNSIVIGKENILAETDTINLDIVCEELGQSFWSRTAEFGIKVHNPTDVKKTYDVTMEIVSDLQVIEFSRIDSVELEPGESKVIDYKADLSRWAKYGVNVTAVDTETDEAKTFDTTIMTIKKSEERNPIMGIHDHSVDSGDGYERYPEKFVALKNAGMSSLRMTFYWEHYETKLGVYAVPDRYKKAFDIAKDLGFDVLFINGYNNVKVAPGEMPPSSPGAITAFSEYAHHLALDTKDYAYGYEVYNEWNVLDHFNRDQLSGSAYVDLLKPTYAKIKEANPDAKVYGLSGMTWNRTELYKQMAEEMFEAGVGDYADGFSMHTYAHQKSPDTGIHYECIEYTQGLMDKYGVGDKELIISEMGWQASYGTPEEVATWVIKYNAMIHDKVDKVIWYCSQRKKRDNVGEAEQSYGWMEDEREDRDYVPYQPLPQLRAVSAYNSFLATAEKLEEVELTDSEGVAHRFARTDGTNVTMAWIKDTAEVKSQAYAVSVDAPTVSVSDMYGNETEYTAKDGKIYLNLTDIPQYIIGNYNTIEFEKVDLSVSTTELAIIANDESVFTIHKVSALSGVKVEVETPDDITVKENNGFAGDKAEVVLAAGSAPKADAFVIAKIVDENSGAVYYKCEIKLNPVNACTIKIVPEKELDGRWKIGIRLNNEKSTSAISGTLEVKEPSFNSDETVKVDFENIGPKSSVTEYIYIPDSWSEARNTVKCEIRLESGENFEVQDKVNLNGFASIDKAPIIDGVISDGEWDKTMPFVLNKESNKSQEMETVWDGPEDLSATFYYNWDKDNLYMAAEVVDNAHCDSVANKTWQNDGIQIAFALSNKKDDPRTEIGLSLFGGESLMERSSWMPVDPKLLGGMQDDDDFGDSEYKIRRDGKMTYYEMKIPWEEIAYDGFDILRYEELYISILVNDNDGEGRRGWLEYCAGIGCIKNAELFEKVKLFR